MITVCIVLIGYPGKTFVYYYYYYQEVKFVNVSMSALGALDSSCDSLMELLEDLDFAEKLRKRLISKIMTIAIRCTYYIFCRRNKEWNDPNLMDF